MVKRILMTAILVAALLIGGMSCMDINPFKPKKGGASAGALAYMEEKYGEPFAYAKAWASSTPQKRQILVSCESMPGKEILVVIDIAGKVESYRDNFMDVYFRPQTTEFFSEIARKYFDDFTIFVNDVRAPSEVSISFDTEFEEYIKNEKHPMIVNMDIADTNADSVIEFLNELKTLGLRFAFSIDILSVNEGYTAIYFMEHDEIYFNRRK